MKNVCLNNLCIYQKNNSCMLDDIILDGSGMCTDMIFVDLDAVTLEKLKLNSRKMFGDEWGE